jgi:hypothetical protein
MTYYYYCLLLLLLLYYYYYIILLLLYIIIIIIIHNIIKISALIKQQLTQQVALDSNNAFVYAWILSGARQMRNIIAKNSH